MKGEATMEHDLYFERILNARIAQEHARKVERAILNFGLYVHRSARATLGGFHGPMQSTLTPSTSFVKRWI